MTNFDQPVFRFAPSPNGALHTGHAYSALLTQKLARQNKARLLLRIEDIDTARCTPNHTQKMIDDLRWLGFSWDEPPVCQSRNPEASRAALEALRRMNLLYPCFCSRMDIKRHASGITDPDGAPVYAGQCRHMDSTERNLQIGDTTHCNWRLDMQQAIERTGDLTWRELNTTMTGTREVAARPDQWGDVVLARKFMATSYHLSVVVDDARQGITHVTRGLDLFQSTAIHRLLQTLLKLPEPIYFHHRLLVDTDGKKLAKSRKSPGIRTLRSRGWTPEQVRAGLEVDNQDGFSLNPLTVGLETLPEPSTGGMTSW